MHPNMQGFMPGYNAQGSEFYAGTVPQGIPMVQGHNGMPVPAMYYNAQGFSMSMGYPQGIPPIGYNPGFNPQMGGNVAGQTFYPGQGTPPGAPDTGAGDNNKGSSEGDGKNEDGNNAEGAPDTSNKSELTSTGSSEGQKEKDMPPASEGEGAKGTKEGKEKKESKKKASVATVVAGSASTPLQMAPAPLPMAS